MLLPVRCAGCGGPDVGVCAACVAALDPVVQRVRTGLLEVVVALDYAGVPARLLGALKEHGRTDVLTALARPFAVALSAGGAAVREAGPVLGPAFGPALAPVRGPGPSCGPVLVTVPSTRGSVRRRGFRPVDALVRRAGFGRPSRPGLQLVREVADQAGLGVEERQANLHGALRASAALGGRRVLIVDDVLTTGATLLEARRALLAAGAHVDGAVCLAYTRRRDHLANHRRHLDDQQGLNR